MESVHGVDVSWMHRTSHSKDTNSHGHHSKPSGDKAQGDRGNEVKESTPSAPRAIPIRPGFSRSGSTEKTPVVNVGSKSPSPSNTRRNSWLSSISSKFSPGSHNANTSSTNPPVSASSPQEPSVPSGPYAPKNAILPHGSKPVGEIPYTPAPPKSTQSSFLQSAFRRLSSSNGQLASGGRSGQHGLCERKVLNVDHDRERCRILDLDQSKLRRVAFCVDVEIASGPRYNDEAEHGTKTNEQKKRMVEKGEGAALKSPKAVQNEKDTAGIIKASGELLPTEPGLGLVVEGVAESTTESPTAESPSPELPSPELPSPESPTAEKDTTRKREKKKRSEEERKARKEKKRRLAEANGTVPCELVRNDSDDSLTPSIPGPATPKFQGSPTTDPVRIYRRCCQLRETPILKKITEQLATSLLSMDPPGVVSKLDLTGYWLQLPDIVTLGDYLAVVPVKELIMENCGLTDEGVRVILSGLLAAKQFSGNKSRLHGQTGWPRGGVVERLVLKGNGKIGRHGWRYICLFINMCRSLKSMDLSKIPFPQAPIQSTSHQHVSGHLKRAESTSGVGVDLSCLLSQALGERLAGKEFELLNVAECGITTDQLGFLVDGVIKSGLRRLGIAGNNITSEGMKHVARFIQSGHCEGLDVGGNDLRDQLGVIAEALDENSVLYAISLADCNLSPDSLWTLFPALVMLNNFRFIDLSQNHDLFSASPSALSLLRRYLPKMPILKRIHLTDCSMTPEQAIALAEILPDTPSLAHVNMLENPKLAALANAKSEASQEEACALYASLMAAVRVSKTIICIDIEVPSTESSEVVKALAKQVVAYCLRNMERGPVAEISEAVNAISEPYGGEKEVAVPDVLLHLVGHVEGFHDNYDNEEPAPDEDYMIGGTGVVKALGICLRNCGNDSRRPSTDRTYSSMSIGGSETPKSPTPVSGGKAKEMSKNLLGSARKIRARLQPALENEARTDGDRNNYMRLLFLDNTLEGMIKRFEDEFPETRLPTTETLQLPEIDTLPQVNPAGSIDRDLSNADIETTFIESPPSDDEAGESNLRPVLSRHNSDVSLASRVLSQEEGRMHRFGQQFRRDILKPEGEDHEHGTTGREITPLHLQMLRAFVEGLDGDEIRKKIENEGRDAVISELANEASIWRRKLMDQDPEGWKRFEASVEMAERNSKLEGRDIACSAIE